MVTSVYFVFTSILLCLLRVEASQEGKPFFFIDFLDESFLPEAESRDLEESKPLLDKTIRVKPLKINEDKIKRNVSHDQQALKTNSPLDFSNNDPTDLQNILNMEDLFTKMENDPLVNQTGNEFLFIEDFFSVFNNSQLQQKDTVDERPSLTVPTSVTNISLESPDFGTAVPLHQMYLRAISSLVQYVMDSLFSFTENVSSRFCETSAMDYDSKPHRKIMKRDLTKPEDKIDAKMETTNWHRVTSSISTSEGITGAPTNTSQGSPEASVTTEVRTSLMSHSNEPQHTSTKLVDDLNHTKLHDIHQDLNIVSPKDDILDVSNDSKEYNYTTDGKQNTQKEELFADYDPVSFLNEKQEHRAGNLEDFHLQRTVRGSFNKNEGDENSKKSSEFYVVTIMIVIVIAMVLGGALVVFSLRKSFGNGNESCPAPESLPC